MALLLCSMLKAASSAAGKSTDLKVLPAGVIYPLDWRNSKGEDDAPNAAKMGFAAKYCAGYVTGLPLCLIMPIKAPCSP